MKLSLKSLVFAVALTNALGFLFISLLNVLLPPYGGAYLAMMMSLYPGYDPVVGPVSIILGTLYALLAGGIAGAVFGWLYNTFVGKS
jgi:hypothetical protein